VFSSEVWGMRNKDTTEYKRAKRKEREGREALEDLDLQSVIPSH